MLRPLVLALGVTAAAMPAAAEMVQYQWSPPVRYDRPPASAEQRAREVCRMMRQSAQIMQYGNNQTASLRQSGRGHCALIDQQGSGHSADVRQSGEPNGLGLIQRGRGTSATIHQRGGQAGIVMQYGW